MGWTKKEGQEIQNNLSLKPGGKSYKIASSFKNVNSIANWIEKIDKRLTIFHLCCLPIGHCVKDQLLGLSLIITVYL